MLQIKELNMTHQSDLRPLISNLDLVVHAGDKLAIVGEEGNGKSSLLRYMMGDASIHEYLLVEGQIDRQYDRYGYLAQALQPAQLNMSIYDYFFQTYSLDTLDYHLLYQVSADLGMEADVIYLTQPLKTLSGGERMKLQLLRLLLEEPPILFLDEPSNDLDIYTIQWLQDFIQTAKQTIVFISHDEALLNQAATCVLQLELLRHRSQARHTYQALDFSTYQAQRQRAFDKQDQLARKQREEDRAKMQKHRRLASKVQHQLEQTRNSEAGRLLAKKFKNIQSQAKRFERERQLFADIPLQEDEIRLEFKGVQPLNPSKKIIDLVDISLQVEGKDLAGPINLRWLGQEKIGLIGSNGVGKSTLLKFIYDQLTRQADFQVGYMAQNYEDQLIGHLTPLEYLTKSGSKEEHTRIMTFLASLNFAKEEMSHPISAISGGQRAKLLLGDLSLQQYPVLLLDEPTRNISPASQAHLRQSFALYPGALLTVSHDRLFIEAICDKVYEMTPQGLVTPIKDMIQA